MIQADVTLIKTDTRFDRMVLDNDLVVAYFYRLSQEESKAKTSERYKEVDHNMTNFRRAGRMQRYSNGGLIFIAVNVSRDNLNAVAEKYNLKANDEFVLFRNGQVYSKPPHLTGLAKRSDIVQFIEKYFSDFIDEQLELQRQEAREERKEQRERERERSSTRTTTYVYERPYYYDRSYYYGRWPYYGGYYGYPYRGYYYGRPYFGFSFGI